MKNPNKFIPTISAFAAITASSVNVYADVIAEPEPVFGGAGGFALPLALAVAAAVVSVIIIGIIKKKKK